MLVQTDDELSNEGSVIPWWDECEKLLANLCTTMLGIRRSVYSSSSVAGEHVHSLSSASDSARVNAMYIVPAITPRRN